jgi:hypothetical protein
MKKETNTKKEAPEKLLIYQDENLQKHNKKILDEIFTDIETIKSRFSEIEVPFNQSNFIKSMEGCNWIEQTLYDKLAENYKGMSDKVIQTLTEDEKVKLQKLVIPIEPILLKIQELLNQIELSAEQLPFNEKNEPIINAELKNLLSEKSKRYVTGTNEIELYDTILKFIESANALEASLAKNGHPLLFTKYLDFSIPMLNAESDTFAYPLALANYDNVLNDEHAVLEINPEYFENIRADIKALYERVKLERELRSMPPEVRFHDSRINIPIAKFKLNPGTGKLVDGTNTDPNIKTNKKRWSGMPGMI